MSKQRRWRWLKRLVGLVLILGTAGFGGWYYLQQGDNGPPEYQTVTVSRGPLAQVVTANGQLNPVVKVQVGSQISGTIDKLFADFNSKVKEGQVIAQIDAATYDAAVQNAEADLAKAQSALELAEVNFARAKSLRAENLNRTSTKRGRMSMRPRPWQRSARLISRRPRLIWRAAPFARPLMELSLCAAWTWGKRWRRA